MKVTLWGTRGSLADAGPQTVRYGGNTACVEVRGEDGGVLVLDAGTGIRRLGTSLERDVRRVDVLLTHLHMDHIVGLGFFAPLYQTGMEVHIWGPSSAMQGLRSRLARYMSPPLFPVLIRDLPCDLHIHDAPRGRFTIGEMSVDADLVLHPGPTMGFRITEGDASVCYLPDHEPALGASQFPLPRRWTSGHDLAKDADLLIHDAQYGDDEYQKHVGWGHSTMSQAMRFATMVRARKLVTFHHDPSHDDARLDALVDRTQAECDCDVDLVAGTEGASFVVTS
jgi:phosphoribosyl 1,2-cyclic phosphodiesterase